MTGAKRVAGMVATASARLSELPRSAFVALGALVVVGTAAGSVFAYRTYDYVQHDNQFCVSCHLMEDPARRFAESRHRDISCKKCHQPTNVQRAKMGLRQVIVQPEEIEAHADVPEARCTACHIDGDPADVPIVDRFRGHVVHRTEAGPALSSVTCTTCHSEGLHDFAASDRACTAAGCHRDALVRLGDMGDLSLHCVACHDFSQPDDRITDPDAAEGQAQPGVLAPTSRTCLSCHDMQDKIDIDPDEEPHGAVCGTCHNAHEQTRPADAGATCSDARCHSAPDEIDDEHHRRASVDLDDCVQCHTVHRFRVDGEACLDCHDEVLGPVSRSAGPREAPRGTPTSIPSPRTFATEHTPARGPLAGEEHRVRAPYAPAAMRAPVQAPAPAADTVFEHDRHRSLQCRQCHTSGESILPESGGGWCSGCHHSERSRRDCSRCHVVADLPAVERTAVFRLPSGSDARSLPFPHEMHAEGECADCHGDPPTAVEPDFACATCHDDHHTLEEGDCLACHEPPPEWAHDEVVVHETCAGGVCHTRFQPAELAAPEAWSRATCLACHPDFTEREPFPALPPRF